MFVTAFFNNQYNEIKAGLKNIANGIFIMNIHVKKKKLNVVKLEFNAFVQNANNEQRTTKKWLQNH